MSLQQTNQIDAIGIDGDTDFVMMYIFDCMDWTDEYPHLQLLQDKVYQYLDCIESGEIDEVYPAAKGMDPAIHVIFKEQIPENARKALASLCEVAKDEGIPLGWEVTE